MYADQAKQPRLGVAEAPSYEQDRLIGVELTYIGPNGEQVELEMFACRHTLPNPRLMPGYNSQMKVTLHMSGGDRAMQIPL